MLSLELVVDKKQAFSVVREIIAMANREVEDFRPDDFPAVPRRMLRYVSCEYLAVFRRLIQAWIEAEGHYLVWLQEISLEDKCGFGGGFQGLTLGLGTRYQSAELQPKPLHRVKDEIKSALKAKPNVRLGRRADPHSHINLELLGRSEAYSHFAIFVLYAAQAPGVGKCDRCQKFYVNRWGHKNKRFCGRQCSNRQTAAEAQDKRQSKQRREKNKRLKQAAREFIGTRPAVVNWRKWICERSGVHQKFLTRVLNRARNRQAGGLTLTKKQQEFFDSLDAKAGNRATLQRERGMGAGAGRAAHVSSVRDFDLSA